MMHSMMLTADPVRYRDYMIFDNPATYKPDNARFEFHHKDFDVDDVRCGYAATLEDAKAEIDEQISDREQQLTKCDHPFDGDYTKANACIEAGLCVCGLSVGRHQSKG